MSQARDGREVASGQGSDTNREGGPQGAHARLGPGRHMNGLDIRQARVWTRRQVGLVEDQEVAGPDRLPEVRRRGLIDHPQAQVSSLGPGSRSADPLDLDRIGGVAQARHVGEQHLETLDHGGNLDHVARRPGDLGDDGRLAPGEAVEQRRLAGVGRADQGDLEAFAHALPAAIVRQGLFKF